MEKLIGEKTNKKKIGYYEMKEIQTEAAPNSCSFVICIEFDK